MGGFIGTLLAFFAVWYIFAAYQNHNAFNAWNRQCNNAGGQISRTHEDVWSTRYECFIDGKQVTLPGWEGK